MVGRSFLVKSSGELEEYDPNKLAIICLKVGVPFRDIDSIVSSISPKVKDGMSTSELRTLVFAYLREKHPEAARNYKKEGEFFVRTTDERIEKWNRARIAESLSKETGTDPELSLIIAKSVEKYLENLNLDFVSGPLIRELINVQLLERGMEDVRARYTRLGLPVYDVGRLLDRTGPDKLIETAGDSVVEQYFLLTIPRHLTDAHFRGVYNIPYLTQFPLHPLFVQHDMNWFLENGMEWNVYDKPAERPETAINHCTRTFRACKSCTVGQGIDGLDSVLDNFEGDYGLLAKFLLYPLNHEGIDCHAVLDLNKDFSGPLLDVYLAGDNAGNPFLVPKPIFRINKKVEDGLLAKAHEYAEKNGAMFVKEGSWVRNDMIEPRTGILHSVTLNLPRISYEAKGDGDLLNSLIAERMEMIKELLTIKYNEMDRRLQNLKFLAQGKTPYFDLKNSSLSIAVVGLNEMVKTHSGKQLHEGGDEFGKAVLKYIRGKIDEFSKDSEIKWVLSGTGASQRLAEKDLMEFGRESVFWSGKEPRYTASCHLPDVEIDVEERAKIEGQFHEFFNGGLCLDVDVKDVEDIVSTTDSVMKHVKAVRYVKG